MGSRQSWRFSNPKGSAGLDEAQFFVGGLERFAEDRFKPVGNFPLAVLKIGNVLDKSLATTRRCALSAGMMLTWQVSLTLIRLFRLMSSWSVRYGPGAIPRHERHGVLLSLLSGLLMCSGCCGKHARAAMCRCPVARAWFS
jgi:hypothetical protein